MSWLTHQPWNKKHFKERSIDGIQLWVWMPEPKLLRPQCVTLARDRHLTPLWPWCLCKGRLELRWPVTSALMSSMTYCVCVFNRKSLCQTVCSPRYSLSSPQSSQWHLPLIRSKGESIKSKSCPPLRHSEPKLFFEVIRSHQYEYNPPRWCLYL